MISGYSSNNIFYKYFDNSFFRQYFDLNDPEILTWALTVLEKLYGKGILPEYVERNNSNNPFDDEVLISLLYTKTHFAAILVKYARTLTNITNNDIIKRYFINQLGLYFRTNETSDDLDYILRNYISEFKKRGTQLVYTKKGDLNEVDGELLRLLDYKYGDEYVFALLNNSEHGWCVGFSSPAYSASDHALNLIKAYEFSEDITDLSLYPLLNSQYITLNSGSILISADSGGITSGIQFDGDENKKIVIDPTVDYEISFKIKILDSSGMIPSIEFGVDVYDIDGNYLYLKSVKTDSTTTDNKFGDFTLPLNNVQYWVRGVISNSNRAVDVNDQLNIGIGNNLKFQPNSIENFIVPRIMISLGQGDIEITDIKIRVISLSFNLTMLGIKNLIAGILENHKGYTDNTIDSIIKNELIPYNCFLISKYL